MIFFFFIDQFLKFFFKNFFTFNFDYIDSFSEFSFLNFKYCYFFPFLSLNFKYLFIYLTYIENYSFFLNYLDFLFFIIKDFFFFLSFYFIFFLYFLKNSYFSSIFFFGFLSNGMDRIINNYVIDYISFKIIFFDNVFFFPIFNVADILLFFYFFCLFNLYFVKNNMSP